MNKLSPRDRSFSVWAVRSEQSTEDDTCRGKRPYILYYLLQNQFTIKFYNTRHIDKSFTISDINIISHILTSLHFATLSQFAVISDTQTIFVLSYPVLNVPNTCTAVLIAVATPTASSNARSVSMWPYWGLALWSEPDPVSSWSD